MDNLTLVKEESEKYKKMCLEKEQMIKEENYKNCKLEEKNKNLENKVEYLLQELERMKKFEEESKKYKKMCLVKEEVIKEEKHQWIKYKAERDSLQQDRDYLDTFNLILPIDSKK